MELSKKRINLILLVIFSFYPLIGMAVDLLAPSLPAISHDLSVSSIVSKNLITAYLFGYAANNFIVGFLLDAFGRRKFIVAGFLLFIVASIIPTFFANIDVLLISRFLQGVAISMFTISARASISDILSPEKLVLIAPVLATLWGIGPVIGPVIGGYLQFYFGWKACFYFFALYGLIEFLLVFIIIPETHVNRTVLSINNIKNNLKEILSHKLFMGAVLLMGINYSILIVFNTLGPFLIQNTFGKTPVFFGHIALWMGFVFLIGTTSCRFLIKQFQPEQILSLSVKLFGLIAVLGLILSYLYPENMWIIIILSLFMFMGVGLVYPAAMGTGIALFRHLAGSASAMMNAINVLLTGITAFLMGFVSVNSILPIALIYMGLMMLSIISYKCLVRS